MTPRKYFIDPKYIVDDLPDSLMERLGGVGLETRNDAKRTDRRLIRRLLECGLTIEQTVATFASSPRGKDANRRYISLDLYLRRQINYAIEEMRLLGWGRGGYAYARGDQSIEP